MKKVGGLRPLPIREPQPKGEGGPCDKRQYSLVNKRGERSKKIKEDEKRKSIHSEESGALH